MQAASATYVIYIIYAVFYHAIVRLKTDLHQIPTSKHFFIPSARPKIFTAVFSLSSSRYIWLCIVEHLDKLLYAMLYEYVSLSADEGLNFRMYWLRYMSAAFFLLTFY